MNLENTLLQQHDEAISIHLGLSSGVENWVAESTKRGDKDHSQLRMCHHHIKSSLKRIPATPEALKDQYPIDTLQEKVFRKILNRAYPKCGKARGALLRILKNFEEEERNSHIVNLAALTKRLSSL
jgi:hypothetical protein